MSQKYRRQRIFFVVSYDTTMRSSGKGGSFATHSAVFRDVSMLLRAKRDERVRQIRKIDFCSFVIRRSGCS